MAGIKYNNNANGTAHLENHMSFTNLNIADNHTNNPLTSITPIVTDARNRLRIPSNESKNRGSQEQSIVVNKTSID